MIKEEFIEYISGFHKKPGEYTEEEFYEIGMRHKELANPDKSWENLAQLVGWPGSGEAYRGFVRRMSKKLQHSAIESTENLNEYDYATALRVLYAEKTKIRDINNEYRRHIREEARIEELKDNITAAARMLPALPKLETAQPKPKAHSKAEAILLLGDWHIGQYADNFYNQYNIDIARERINKIVLDAVKYCHTHSVSTLNVINLGDLIEGIIHTNGRVEQETDVCSQIMIAAEYLAQALNILQEAAPVVTYRSCTDNHSRAIADKHQNIAKENFYRLVDWYVKERLKDSSIIFCEDNLDAGFGNFRLEHNDKNVVFFHGHEGSKHQTLQEVIGATQEWVDIVCCGHWHNPSEHVYQNMRMFVNNSLCGTGPYALSKRYFTKPSQKLIIVNNDTFIDIDIAAE